MAKLDLLIVVAYMIGIVGAGFWARRKATSQEQFLVAGRSVGPWLYSGTLAAIVLGGASTVGGVKLGYQYGISGHVVRVHVRARNPRAERGVWSSGFSASSSTPSRSCSSGATTPPPASRAASSWWPTISWSA